MKFIDKLLAATRRNNSLLCIGLDTDPDLIPENVSVFEFNRDIIEATKDLVCAYKPNLGFYEAQGIEGLQALKRTVDYIPDNIPVIADAKRSDIGNTAKGYAMAIFELYKFDAVTVNPYMGLDSVQPFIDHKDKLIFILALTSNKSAEDFEKIFLSDGSILFQKVISKANEWNEHGNCGIVFGATNSEELKTNIALFQDLTVLLPGVGAQGGSLEDVVSSFKNAGHQNYIINISRALLYADQSEKFGMITRNILAEYNNKIKDLH